MQPIFVTLMNSLVYILRLVVFVSVFLLYWFFFLLIICSLDLFLLSHKCVACWSCVWKVVCTWACTACVNICLSAVLGGRWMTASHCVRHYGVYFVRRAIAPFLHLNFLMCIVIPSTKFFLPPPEFVLLNGLMHNSQLVYDFLQTTACRLHYSWLG